jgi:hypothetical protein
VVFALDILALLKSTLCSAKIAILAITIGRWNGRSDNLPAVSKTADVATDFAGHGSTFDSTSCVVLVDAEFASLAEVPRGDGHRGTLRALYCKLDEPRASRMSVKSEAETASSSDFCPAPRAATMLLVF